MAKANYKRFCRFCGKERLGLWDLPHEEIGFVCPAVKSIEYDSEGNVRSYELWHPVQQKNN